MTPRPDVSWQAVALDARVQGAFERPNVNGQLRLDQVDAAGGGVQRLTADISGNQGLVHLHATADGLRVPGSPPDLFASAPLTLDATAHLRRLTVRSSSRSSIRCLPRRARRKPLVPCRRRCTSPSRNWRRSPPWLAPHYRVTPRSTSAVGCRDGSTQLAVTGTVGLYFGTPPAPALLGNDAHIDLLASMHGQDLTVTRFALNGQEATASVHGRAGPDNVDLDWSVALSGSHRGATEPEGQAGCPGACRWHAAEPFGGNGSERSRSPPRGSIPARSGHTFRHRACQTRPTAR